MFGLHTKNNPWSMANDIAKEISRRGFPAETKHVTVMSAMGNVRKCAIVVPGRGVAVINNDLDVVVASSNKPLPQAPVFDYKGAEAAAENILRNLPLP
uniref:Uncharacterized protein n=1 Tax=Siphoviridae sp. ctgaU3 TaxID=2825609 RepID=A0A8S5UW21_9CAUD|nr:MAG TPA: hypothetical protein [Siphoviridae sp. ctgaU3]